jgi:hypothetical protein
MNLALSRSTWNRQIAVKRIVEVLSRFTSMTRLGLSDNEVCDIEPLAGLTDWYALDTANNAITEGRSDLVSPEKRTGARRPSGFGPTPRIYPILEYHFITSSRIR